jgi:hypothetical protein
MSAPCVGDRVAGHCVRQGLASSTNSPSAKREGVRT